MNRHDPGVEQRQGLLWRHLVEGEPEVGQVIQLINGDHLLATWTTGTDEGQLKQAQNVHNQVLDVVWHLLLVDV